MHFIIANLAFLYKKNNSFRKHTLKDKLYGVYYRRGTWLKIIEKGKWNESLPYI